MKKRIPQVITLITVLAWFVGIPLAGAQGGDISFTATVDRTTISTDDQLTLTLTLQGPVQNVPEPRLSSMDGFEVYSSSRSQNISIINNQISTSVGFTYIMRPTKAGQFTIGPAEVTIAGQTYTTDPITIDVVQGQLPTPTPAVLSPTAPDGAQQAAPPPASMDSQTLFARTETDKSEAYLGEQVTLSFQFYQGKDLFGADLNYSPPETVGFWSEDLPPDQRYYQQVGQRRYLVQELRTALFPTALGEQTIGPARLEVRDFFNRIPLQSDPITLKVKPLPEEGKPAEFGGAVGRYEVQATVDKNETAVNDPVTLSVTVRGFGNISSLPAPVWPELENVRTYDGETQTNVATANYTVQGERRFDRLIVPKQPGELVIPPIRYAYFDPETQRYQIAETAVMHVSVIPGTTQEPTGITLPSDRQNLSVVGYDIRHIKPAPSALSSQGMPLYRSTPFWITWVLPPLLIGCALALQHSRRRLRDDIAYARSRRSRKAAHSRLRRANKLLHNGETDAFYAEVSHALRHYLGDKLNVAAAGLTLYDIRRALETRGASEELVAQVAGCCAAGDMGRFAPGAGTSEDMARLLAATENAIAQLEGIRWNGK